MAEEIPKINEPFQQLQTDDVFAKDQENPNYTSKKKNVRFAWKRQTYTTEWTSSESQNEKKNWRKRWRKVKKIWKKQWMESKWMNVDKKENLKVW